MPFPKIITIDGPAASGKSTLGKKIADTLDYLFFDTGVMYRAVTWAALLREVEIGDEEAITTLANEIELDIRPPSQADGRNCDILADGEDITWQIRRAEVDASVSQVSAYPGVRRALSTQQRRIGLRGSVVMVGRDIGTVVLPEAELKIYLDASVEERARRRYLELRQRGETADLADITQSMRLRDQIDSTRQFAPLRQPADAFIVNSDQLSFDQVLDLVMDLIRRFEYPAEDIKEYQDE
jgi:cytidylate kinase